MKTLTDITNYSTHDEGYSTYYENLLGLMSDKTMKENIIKKEISSLDIPLNVILYGPPGTGKTYALKNEYVKYFTDEEATITKEEFCIELIKDLAWWEIISIVMLDIEEAKVQEIYNHPLLQAKITISENKTPKNTIWGWLQRHTKEDCENVNLVKRDTPLFFSKDKK